jgi:hypothetical protein
MALYVYTLGAPALEGERGTADAFPTTL